MKQMICTVCSYTYLEEVGIQEAGIAPGTKWEELPSEWKCPCCGASKDAFKEKRLNAEDHAEKTIVKPHVDEELSAMEMSIICSNLARGCEKQYLPEQAKAFCELADFFKFRDSNEGEANVQALLNLIEKDLSMGYPYANAVAAEKADRGAMRCLVWSERVTRMLQSLLRRYKTEGDKMLENTGVYVCSICGFVYVGEMAPELCPVCKVPGWKFEKAEGRA